jgi:CDP-diacylglycerol--serine O-phosphatidyltransferase
MLMKHIPNSITLTNLIFGILGIIFLFQKQYEWVPVCMIAALIADFADGMIARALKITSPLGKQLDSLADNVTFGVLPALMWYHVLQQLLYVLAGSKGIQIYLLPFYLQGIPYLALVFAVCACLRLAKFNIDERQSNFFIGIPTPAAAIFTLGIFMTPMFKIPIYLVLLILFAISILMVVELPILSFKMKDKKPIVGVVIASIIALFVLKWLGLCVAILLLVMASIIFRKKIA